MSALIIISTRKRLASSIRRQEHEMVALSTRTLPTTQPVAPKQVDLQSFNQLVLEYQDVVYRQAYWILGEPEAAEDAAQEAFLRAYRKMNLFNGGPFLPWILRITTNYCLDQLRRKKVRKSLPLEAFNEYDEEIDCPAWLEDPNASVEEGVVRAEERAWILRCIRSLPADSRAAIVLVDLQDLDYTQAAAAMGVCLGTFKSRLARARLQLQHKMKSRL
jgi:RNA polymerase sigma-70 factor (ECF subfamily)